jgi:hypothetical protein
MSARVAAVNELDGSGNGPANAPISGATYCKLWIFLLKSKCPGTILWCHDQSAGLELLDDIRWLGRGNASGPGLPIRNSAAGAVNIPDLKARTGAWAANRKPMSPT